MPVLGADTTDAPVRSERPVTHRYDLFRLCDYLLHHGGAQVMSNPPRHEHGQIALRTVSRLIRRGYTYSQIRSAIDKFYARYSDFDKHPVYLFTSSNVLQGLFMDESLSVTDPVLQFMANGFVRDSLELMWHEDDDDDIRKVIMVTGGDLVYRYPDVVADAVVEWYDDIATLREQIRLISDVVRWNLSDTDEADVQILLDRIAVRLPAELKSTRRSPKSLRPPQQTISEAVAQVAEKVSTDD
jgi:hypothetical protein